MRARAGERARIRYEQTSRIEQRSRAQRYWGSGWREGMRLKMAAIPPGGLPGWEEHGWEGPRLCPAWTLCGRPIRVCVSEVAVVGPARPDVFLSPRGNSPAGGRRTDGTGRMEVPWGGWKRYLGTSPMECLLLVPYFRYLQYSSQMPRRQLGGGTGQCTCSVAHCCAAPPPHLLPPPPHDTPPRLRL